MARKRKPKVGPSTFIVGAIAVILSCIILAPDNAQTDDATHDVAKPQIIASDGTQAGARIPSEDPLPEDSEGARPREPSGTPDVAGNASTATQISASELLETLEVKGRAPKTGYDRKAKFGTPWADIDRNGCDTRNDILQRDLTDTTLSGPCKVLSGTLNDKYTGETIDFVRGNKTSTLVQIDHVVALMDAWQKGAQSLIQEQRIAFANDPLNLMATDGPTNSAKGAGDAATWLPKNKAFRCEYVARQISVKAAYGLWVTQAEKSAMERVLASCEGQQAYTSDFAAVPSAAPPQHSAPAPAQSPTPAPTPTHVPVPSPAPMQALAPAPTSPTAPGDTYFKNCTAARAAGAAPVYHGDPGYGRHLDRDGDGIGCE